MALAEGKYRILLELPPFPAIATKLLRVLSSDHAEVQRVVELIRADVGLSGELLRIVNSPLYGFPGRIISLQSAVTLLGLDAVQRFALTITTRDFLHGASRLDVLRRIWRHSLACGLLGEELAGVCGVAGDSGDLAYTAGLLHNIGSLGLFMADPQLYGSVLTEATDQTILERERQSFGIDHCEAGGWLAKTWSLPEELHCVCAEHHEPPNPAFQLIDVIRVTVKLAAVLGFDPVISEQRHTLNEIRAVLPHAAQYRFDPDPDLMAARITHRLDSFD